MKRIIIAATILFTASLSNAQTATPAINQTQQVQEKKINQGIKSGEISKQEAVKLDAQQDRIQHTKKVAKSDGVVTPHEKKVIKKKQRSAAKRIHKQKHDVQPKRTVH